MNYIKFLDDAVKEKLEKDERYQKSSAEVNQLNEEILIFRLFLAKAKVLKTL